MVLLQSQKWNIINNFYMPTAIARIKLYFGSDWILILKKTPIFSSFFQWLLFSHQPESSIGRERVCICCCCCCCSISYAKLFTPTKLSMLPFHRFGVFVFDNIASKRVFLNWWITSWIEFKQFSMRKPIVLWKSASKF